MHLHAYGVEDFMALVTQAVSESAQYAEKHATVFAERVFAIDSSLDLNMTVVLMVCTLMYGTVGLFWLLFTRMPKDHPRYEHARTVLLCVCWCTMSIGMHTLNKSLATALKAPALISIAQMLVAVAAMAATSMKDVWAVDKKALSWWMIVPGFFSAMLISSFYTYQFISLSMLTVVRNLTPMVVLPIETMVMPADKRPAVNLWVVASILIMLAGACIYAGNISDLSVIGLSFAFLNMILAASDRLIQRRLLTTECSEMPSSVCTLVNNTLGMVPTLCVALFTGEIAKIAASDSGIPAGTWTDPRVWVLLTLSGFVGIGICYLGFECQRVISATSFFVLQNVSKVAVVSMGITVFHDPITSPWIILGLLLSIGGSFAYSKSQLDLSESAKEKGGVEEKTALIPKKDNTQKV